MNDVSAENVQVLPNSNEAALRREKRSIKGKIGRRYDAMATARFEISMLTERLRHIDAELAAFHTPTGAAP